MDNYLYFCPYDRYGKISNWEFELMNFHGDKWIDRWFNRFEKVTVLVLKRLRNDLELVINGTKGAEELFPAENEIDADELVKFQDYIRELDKIIEHQDCIARVRYFAW